MPEPKSKLIVQEVVGKFEDYEGRMQNFMSEIGEWSDLYKVKRPQRKKKAFSNPRLTEFFRACNALSTIIYRMLTVRDPFFGIAPVGGDPSYDDLQTVVHVLKTQLKYSKYRGNLLRACNFVVPFGTVVCQEDFRVVGVNPIGRRIPLTTFIPRALDQVAFDRGTIDIDDADWIGTADVTSNKALLRIAEEADSVKVPWNKEVLEAAAKEVEQDNTINEKVLQRLTRDGTSYDSAFKDKKELLMYYGKLDTMNDSVEYVLAIVNRKHLVRFHANRFQHGKRQFRIGKYIDFDGPFGIGVGQIGAAAHRSMDANRQRAQDNITMAAMNMWKRRKNRIDDADFEIGPNRLVDVEEMGDLEGLNVPTAGAVAALSLEEVMKQEFRAATAPDTMQALITKATASEVTLSQNEGLRNVSVKAEGIADSLVREHLEVSHWNNIQNINASFNINKAGISRTVYPIDLRIDVDFEALVTTDKDFKPERLEKLVQLAQILTSTKSSHPDLQNITIKPLIKQAAFMLDVNPEDMFSGPQNPGMMGAGDLAALAGLTAGSPEGVVSTPVGDVLASP